MTCHTLKLLSSKSHPKVKGFNSRPQHLFPEISQGCIPHLQNWLWKHGSLDTNMASESVPSPKGGCHLAITTCFKSGAMQQAQSGS